MKNVISALVIFILFISCDSKSEHLKLNKSIFFILFVGFMSLLSSCTPEETPQKPILTTASVSKITEATAVCGGSITSEGGAEVTARGVCWSTAPNPTIADSLTVDDTDTVTFVSALTLLSPSTTYYIRAYATNKIGTAYGMQVTFTTKTLDLTTITPTFIMAQSAISGGLVSSDGDSLTIKARGVCWNTFPNPTISDSITIDGKGKGSYTSTMTGLKPFTTYYIRAYVTNNNGTNYGNELNFTTQNAVISSTTQPVSNLRAVSATLAGNITGDGGLEVTERGFCWSISEHPTVTDNIVVVGKGTGSFSTGITGLIPNRTYYARVYGINEVGTYYGTEISFTTPNGVILLTTTAASSILTTTATSGGTISSDGGASVTARGVCWSTTTNPTVNLTTKTSNSSGTGSFTSAMTGLSPGVVYYVRAYATNIISTYYGAETSFTTKATMALVTTSAVTSITSETAVSGGLVSSDGSAIITARGVCWSKSVNPTVSLLTKTSDETGPGAFTSILTSLQYNTTYHVRAYATNSAGTAYGNDVSFTTAPVAPTLTTTAVSSINALSASSGGTISNDGGSRITARGVCWNTSSKPTTTDNTSSDGTTGAGSFTNQLKALSPNTTYYVRAYATNAAGTSYGDEFSFTTDNGVVVLTTTAGKVITAITAIFGGTITSDGGASVTARGICWSTSSNPTATLDSKTISGTGLGTFSSNLTNLLPTTTYYARAYATNGANTYYGNEFSFTTSELVTDIDGNVYNTVTIGTQIWMVQNLRTTKFRDGTPIPNVTDGLTWADLTTSAYCNINNNPNAGVGFGRLYNGYTVFNSISLAPIGWHVATDADWTTLTTFAGGTNVAGGKLKQAGYTLWETPNANATNEYGFTAIPNYYRSQYGVFNPFGSYSYWWTSTMSTTTDAWGRGMGSSDPFVSRNGLPLYFGLSVRCVKD